MPHSKPSLATARMVSAHSRQEAEAIAEKGIAGQLGKVEVQPTEEERIQDWDFSLKGEVVVNRKQEEV